MNTQDQDAGAKQRKKFFSQDRLSQWSDYHPSITAQARITEYKPPPLAYLAALALVHSRFSALWPSSPPRCAHKLKTTRHPLPKLLAKPKSRKRPPPSKAMSSPRTRSVFARPLQIPGPLRHRGQ